MIPLGGVEGGGEVVPLEMMEVSVYQKGWWCIKLWITEGGLNSEP